MEQKLKIAVFIDFDNIEIGVKSTLHREFDVAAVLDALKERGEIVTKFAYANWGRQESATRALSEHAVQMVQRDPSPRGDKNGADINLALDALDIDFGQVAADENLVSRTFLVKARLDAVPALRSSHALPNF